jgi:sugar phosphate isomerase/epimerase
MEIGISNPIFSLYDFEEILMEVAKHFKYWEIVAEGKHHLPKIKDQLSLLSSHKMKFSIHSQYSDINIGSLNDAIRETSVNEITEAIKIAAGAGASLFTFHPGHISPFGRLCLEDIRKATKNSIREIAKIGEDRNITLAVENMPNGGLFCKPDSLLELIDGTSIGICFDIGHANTTGTIDGFLEYTDLFVNVHIHDNMGKEDLHMELGKGTTPPSSIKQLLKKYNKGIILEIRSIEDGIRSRERLLKILNEC